MNFLAIEGTENNPILQDFLQLFHQVSIAGPIEGVEEARRRIRVSGQCMS